MIDWGNGQHKVIVGMTGTGKTHTSTHTIATIPQGVLYFNTMHVNLPRQFVRADGRANLDSLMAAIEIGAKIDFRPSTDLTHASSQLVAIVNGLYDRKWADFIFAVDETHLYRGPALQALLRAITTGRNQGVEMAMIVQRLALLDNTLMTQSPYKVIFSLENETKYCLSYGIPYPEIEDRIKRKDPGGYVGDKWQPSHAYCTYFQGRVEGAYKYGV